MNRSLPLAALALAALALAALALATAPLLAQDLARVRVGDATENCRLRHAAVTPAGGVVLAGFSDVGAADGRIVRGVDADGVETFTYALPAAFDGLEIETVVAHEAGADVVFYDDGDDEAGVEILQLGPAGDSLATLTFGDPDLSIPRIDADGYVFATLLNRTVGLEAFDRAGAPVASTSLPGEGDYADFRDLRLLDDHVAVVLYSGVVFLTRDGLTEEGCYAIPGNRQQLGYDRLAVRGNTLYSLLRDYDDFDEASLLTLDADQPGAPVLSDVELPGNGRFNFLRLAAYREDAVVLFDYDLVAPTVPRVVGTDGTVGEALASVPKSSTFAVVDRCASCATPVLNLEQYEDSRGDWTLVRDLAAGDDFYACNRADGDAPAPRRIHTAVTRADGRALVNLAGTNEFHLLGEDGALTPFAAAQAYFPVFDFAGVFALADTSFLIVDRAYGGSLLRVDARGERGERFDLTGNLVYAGANGAEVGGGFTLALERRAGAYTFFRYDSLGARVDSASTDELSLAPVPGLELSLREILGASFGPDGELAFFAAASGRQGGVDYRYVLASYRADGSVAYAYAVDDAGDDGAERERRGYVHDLTHLPDGSVLAYGNFYPDGGAGFARLDEDGVSPLVQPRELTRADVALGYADGRPVVLSGEAGVVRLGELDLTPGAEAYTELSATAAGGAIDLDAGSVNAYGVLAYVREGSTVLPNVLLTTAIEAQLPSGLPAAAAGAATLRVGHPARTHLRVFAATAEDLRSARLLRLDGAEVGALDFACGGGGACEAALPRDVTAGMYVLALRDGGAALVTVAR